jgi:RHS repeat-associated protein
MAGISSKAFEKLENDKKYNGIEFDKSLGIDICDAQLRELDPQIGRWWQVDPEIEDMEMWSPYASNYDNPIRYSDPLGNVPEASESCCELLRKAAIAAGGVLNGALNRITGGAWSTAPAGTENYSDEDLELYQLSVRAGQFAAEFPLFGGRIKPILRPRMAPAVEIPVVAPLTPPAATERANSSSGTSPNPYGSPGKPDHQEKVRDLNKQAQKEAKPGETVLQERKIQGHDSRRRPDVQIVDKNGKARKVFEAERKPNSQRNLNREKEYKKLKVDQETHPLKN